jgi:ribosomal protein L37AE/L43A
MTTCEHKWHNTDRRSDIWTCQYCDALYTTKSSIPPGSRNEVLEEVALEFDKMKALGDTAASFAVYVRNMKK